MISSLCFVPRGAAAARPQRFEMSAEQAREMARLKERLARDEAEDAARAAGETAGKAGAKAAGSKAAGAKACAKAGTKAGTKATGKASKGAESAEGLDANGLPAELHMDDYGEDHDELNWKSEVVRGAGVGADEDEDLATEDMIEAAAGQDSDGDSEEAEGGDAGEGEEEDEEEGNGMSEDEEDEEAAGLREQLEQDDGDDDDSLDSEEAEDTAIRTTDRLIVCAHTDEEFSNLEVYLYDENEGAMYVHHDIALPAFPLCTAWLGCGRGVFGAHATTDSRNYIAVGTFKPEIEIWNLDVLDVLEPTVALGGEGDKHSHRDAVMGLAWNSQHHHLLASGSADKTVKLWDLSTRTCSRTWKHHSDKVNCVEWNPAESSVLLTGGFDKQLCVLDGKSADGGAQLRMRLAADVEACAWNPFRASEVTAATEDGKVTTFDVRQASKPLYAFQAHKAGKPCSSLSFSSLVKGLLATCSADKSVKLWDVEAAVAGSPQTTPLLVGSKTMDVGALFDVAFDASEPFLLGAGGDKGSLALWDIAEEHNIKQRFGSRVVAAAALPEPQQAPAPPAQQDPGAAEEEEVGEEEEGMGEAAPSSSKQSSKTKKKNKKKSSKQ